MLKPVIAVDKMIKIMQPQYLGPDFIQYDWIQSLGIGLFLTTSNKKHKQQTNGAHFAH